MDETKVDRARENGLHVVRGNALEIPREAQVRFVSMMDFLEHLPDLENVKAILSAASLVATDFLFIRHPSFEGEAYLSSLGLRQYWWDWRGHTVHINVSDYCNILEQLGLHQYFFRFREPIMNSAHPSILPLGTPRDQHEYDPTQHPPKPQIEFAEPVWRAQDIFIALRGFDFETWAKITRS